MHSERINRLRRQASKTREFSGLSFVDADLSKSLQLFAMVLDARAIELEKQVRKAG